MFSPEGTSRDFDSSQCADQDMTSKQNRLNLQIQASTPTRNTIRTSPNVQTMQQNGQSMFSNYQDNVFNFTDDCNYQGKTLES